MKNKIHIARRFQDAQAESARIQTMLKLERLLWESGKKYVAGIDEAGRGPLAGPVVAAAVVFPENIEIHGIDDSKSLTEKQPQGDHIDQVNAVLHEMPMMVERLLDKALQAAHSEQQRKPAKSRNKRQKDAEANTSQKPESR